MNDRNEWIEKVIVTLVIVGTFAGIGIWGVWSWNREAEARAAEQAALEHMALKQGVVTTKEHRPAQTFFTTETESDGSTKTYPTFQSEAYEVVVAGKNDAGKDATGSYYVSQDVFDRIQVGQPVDTSTLTLSR